MAELRKVARWWAQTAGGHAHAATRSMARRMRPGQPWKMSEIWSALTFDLSNLQFLHPWSLRQSANDWSVSRSVVNKNVWWVEQAYEDTVSDVRSNDCKDCAALKQKLGWRMYCWISDERTDDSNLDRSAPASSSMLALDWPRFKQIETELWRNWLYRSLQDVENLSVMPSHVPAAAESAFRQSLQQR